MDGSGAIRIAPALREGLGPAPQRCRHVGVTQIAVWKVQVRVEEREGLQAHGRRP